MVFASVMPIVFRSRSPELDTASMDLSSGVFSSMHLPKWVTKAQGMYKHLSMTKGGDARSQVVKAAAECVTRSPPLGKEDPSVSPWKRRSWGRQAFIGLVTNGDPNSRSMRVSFLKAPSMPPTAPPPPRSGKNQWAKSMAPSSRAQVNMDSAMTFWSSSGVGSPVMRHSLKRWTTALGSFSAITASSNIQLPRPVRASAMAIGGKTGDRCGNGNWAT
mmetsp:Transcript_58159/g.138450  ORF Transcript_58159/g.138450 Transcript_58159/m.138450 type:complete len:217 (+) Transcript_58159:731-1381(+)